MKSTFSTVNQKLKKVTNTPKGPFDQSAQIELTLKIYYVNDPFGVNVIL